MRNLETRTGLPEGVESTLRERPHMRLAEGNSVIGSVVFDRLDSRDARVSGAWILDRSGEVQRVDGDGLSDTFRSVNDIFYPPKRQTQQTEKRMPPTSSTEIISRYKTK